MSLSTTSIWQRSRQATSVACAVAGVAGLALMVQGHNLHGVLALAACTVLLRSSDNAELVVPNQTFFTTSTTTYTRSDRMRRASINLSVSRRWPPQQIISLLKQIAQDHPQVMAEPGVTAKLMEFGGELYSYSLSYSVPDPLIAAVVTAELRLAIVDRFSSLGIEPPQ